MGTGASLCGSLIPTASIMGMGTGLFLYRRLIRTAFLMVYISIAIHIDTSLIARDFRFGFLVAAGSIMGMSAGNFLCGLTIATILIVNMGTGMTRYCFHISALCSM